MDPILTAAMSDDSFGSDWRPGTGGETGKKRRNGASRVLPSRRRGGGFGPGGFCGASGFRRQSQLSPQPVSGREREGVRGDPDT